VESLELSPEIVSQIDILEDLSITPIDTAEEFETAGKTVLKVAGMKKSVEGFFAEMKTNAYKAWKTICDKESSYTKKLDEIRQNFNCEMGKYQAELRRIEAENQRKLQEEADNKAAIEREKLLARAVKAETAGNSVKADAIFERAMEVVPAVTIAPAVAAPRVPGLIQTETWVAVVVDPKLVPAYHNDVEIRTVNQGQLDKIGKLTDGKAVIPGVKWEKRFGTQARGGR